jgi:transposase
MKKLQLVAMGDQEAEAARKPPAGTAVKIAIDLSRTKWVYAIRWGGQERRRLTTPAQLKHLQALVAQYPNCPVCIAYEACGFGYDIAWWAQEQNLDITVIAPSRMERTPGLQVKTDRLDASKMARKLELGELRSIYIPRRTAHNERQVARSYGQVLKERKRAQTRIRSLMQEHGRLGPPPQAHWKTYNDWLQAQVLDEHLGLCVGAMLAIRSMADIQARALKARMLAIAGSERYARCVEALCTQPGIGPLSAIRFILEIGDVRRFANADSIAHYLGLTPSEYSSGPTVQRGPILKCGPGTLRACMVQCAWVAVRSKGGDPPLREMYERLVERTGKKRAIVAVTRRLVRRCRARWLELEEGAAAA